VARPAAWRPGAWATRRPVPRITRPFYTSEPSLSGHATPGLARETDIDGADPEQDALGATLKWLAARRGRKGDPG
jgi:hypothetical protein